MKHTDLLDFTIGDIYTLKKNEVLKVNATTMSIQILCKWLEMFQPQLADSKLCNGSVDVGEVVEERNMFVVYNGSQVCAGMNEKEIKITNPDEKPILTPKKCNYKCMAAELDSPNQEFSYHRWIIILDNITFEDKLILKAGAFQTFASILLVLSASIMATII